MPLSLRSGFGRDGYPRIGLGTSPFVKPFLPFAKRFPPFGKPFPPFRTSPFDMLRFSFLPFGTYHQERAETLEMKPYVLPDRPLELRQTLPSPPVVVPTAESNGDEQKTSLEVNLPLGVFFKPHDAWGFAAPISLEYSHRIRARRRVVAAVESELGYQYRNGPFNWEFTPKVGYELAPRRNVLPTVGLSVFHRFADDTPWSDPGGGVDFTWPLKYRNADVNLNLNANYTLFNTMNDVRAKDLLNMSGGVSVKIPMKRKAAFTFDAAAGMNLGLRTLDEPSVLYPRLYTLDLKTAYEMKLRAGKSIDKMGFRLYFKNEFGSNVAKQGASPYNYQIGASFYFGL